MNQEKIGKFIAECRKKKNLTQSELAEILGVSDKSISKWENGRCMPDVSLMKPLCEKLDITINELFCGERLESDTEQSKLEETIIINIGDLKQKMRKILRGISIILISIPIIFIVFAIIFTCVQEYQYHKKELPKEIGSVSICQYDDTWLSMSIQPEEGIPAFVDRQKTDGKWIYTLYQTRNTRLMADSDWGGTYSIKLKLRGIENAYMEVPEEIYYYSELLWKKGMEIPMCEEIMELPNALYIEDVEK